MEGLRTICRELSGGNELRDTEGCPFESGWQTLANRCNRCKGRITGMHGLQALGPTDVPFSIQESRGTSSRSDKTLRRETCKREKLESHIVAYDSDHIRGAPKIFGKSSYRRCSEIAQHAPRLDSLHSRYALQHRWSG